MRGFEFHVVGVSHSCGQFRIRDRGRLGLSHKITPFLLQLTRELPILSVRGSSRGGYRSTRYGLDASTDENDHAARAGGLGGTQARYVRGYALCEASGVPKKTTCVHAPETRGRGSAQRVPPWQSGGSSGRREEGLGVWVGRGFGVDVYTGAHIRCPSLLVPHRHVHPRFVDLRIMNDLVCMSRPCDTAEALPTR